MRHQYVNLAKEVFPDALSTPSRPYTHSSSALPPGLTYPRREDRSDNPSVVTGTHQESTDSGDAELTGAENVQWTTSAHRPPRPGQRAETPTERLVDLRATQPPPHISHSATRERLAIRNASIHANVARDRLSAVPGSGQVLGSASGTPRTDTSNRVTTLVSANICIARFLL